MKQLYDLYIHGILPKRLQQRQKNKDFLKIDEALEKLTPRSQTFLGLSEKEVAIKKIYRYLNETNISCEPCPIQYRYPKITPEKATELACEYHRNHQSAFYKKEIDLIRRPLKPLYFVFRRYFSHGEGEPNFDCIYVDKVDGHIWEQIDVFRYQSKWEKEPELHLASVDLMWGTPKEKESALAFFAQNEKIEDRAKSLKRLLNFGEWIFTEEFKRKMASVIREIETQSESA